jgi:hypothetical protein
VEVRGLTEDLAEIDVVLSEAMCNSGEATIRVLRKRQSRSVRHLVTLIRRRFPVRSLH